MNRFEILEGVAEIETKLCFSRYLLSSFARNYDLQANIDISPQSYELDRMRKDASTMYFIMNSFLLQAQNMAQQIQEENMEYTQEGGQ